MQADRMQRRGAGIARHEHADQEIPARRHVQTHRVAHGDGSHGNRERAFSAECQSAIRSGSDRRIFTAQRDMGRPDIERRSTVRIGKLNANAVPADAGTNHHADGLVVETDNGPQGPRRSRGLRRCRRLSRGGGSLRNADRLRGPPLLWSRYPGWYPALGGLRQCDLGRGQRERDPYRSPNSKSFRCLHVVLPFIPELPSRQAYSIWRAQRSSGPQPFLGTNARKRRGLSYRIVWMVSSFTPAATSLGAKTVLVRPYMGPSSVLAPVKSD